jgi:NAD-dependent deacetylase
MHYAPALHEVAALLRDAKHVVVFTGAGISAESGVPTYRSGGDGLWSRQNMEKYANPSGYRRHLDAAYAWYRARARGVSEVAPNAGHYAIAQLETLVPRCDVITQNVDNLHYRAGSRDVVELHGSLREFRCDGCGYRVGWESAPDSPRCACGDVIRPGVVMFEEMLPEEAFAAARGAAASCDMLISIGTSNQVWPARELPILAQSSGAGVVIVNPDLVDQPAGRGIHQIAGASGAVLPALLELAWAGRLNST